MVKRSEKSHLKYWNGVIDQTNNIDQTKITESIENLYDDLKLGKPKVIVVPSPFSAIIEYCNRSPTRKTIKNTILNCIEKNCIDKPNKHRWSLAQHNVHDLWIETFLLDSLNNPSSTFEKKKIKEMTTGLGDIFRDFDSGNLCQKYSFFSLSYEQEVKNNNLIDFSKFNLLKETIINGGPRLYHKDFCIVSDFPELIKRDHENLLHSDNGPAIKWRDGWALYFWHGTPIPENWITDPQFLTAKVALKISNLEKRRIACEIVGWDRMLKELKAVVIDTDADPQIGQLVKVKFPNANGVVDYFLRVTCGTGRSFALPVPNTMKTALQANAWTYNVPVSVLRNLAART